MSAFKKTSLCRSKNPISILVLGPEILHTSWNYLCQSQLIWVKAPWPGEAGQQIPINNRHCGISDWWHDFEDMHQFRKEGFQCAKASPTSVQASCRSKLPQISSAVRRDPTTQSKEAKMPHNEQGANEHEVTAPSRQIPDVTPPSYICIPSSYLQPPTHHSFPCRMEEWCLVWDPRVWLQGARKAASTLQWKTNDRNEHWSHYVEFREAIKKKDKGQIVWVKTTGASVTNYSWSTLSLLSSDSLTNVQLLLAATRKASPYATHRISDPHVYNTVVYIGWMQLLYHLWASIVYSIEQQYYGWAPVE